MAFDVKIRNGLIFDGDGGEPVHADIGVRNGRIAEIGCCAEAADRSIDAEGAIVTPGFIDLHTHYDGQVSWDEEMRPSVNFGVTTVLMGNCGVGFAPVRPADHDRLIRLMEGVEDIPGTALHEGVSWGWESFGDYLNKIDAMPHTIDFAAMAVHDPIRVYAMGERATFDNDAGEDDIKLMQALVKEALDAGAAGFSIGRSDVHRTADGDWTPSSEASREELVALASVMKGRANGVLQIVNDFNLERECDQFADEFALVEAFARAGGKPCSISLMQRDLAPDQWQRILKETERLNADGVDFRVQVAPRGIGVFNGLQCTMHPLMAQPLYREIKDKPLEERVAIMRDPDFKRRCLADKPVKLAGPGSSTPPIVDTLIAAGVSATVYDAGRRYDNDHAARTACLRAVVGDVPPVQLTHLVIEQDDTLVRWDRQQLVALVHAAGCQDSVRYRHERAKSELMLTIPDAIAWCWARGGEWRQRIRGVTTVITV